MKTKFKDRQTLFDLALLSCGSAESAFELAALNNVSITDTTTEEVRLPAVNDKGVVEFFSNRKTSPATELETEPVITGGTESGPVRGVKKNG